MKNVQNSARVRFPALGENESFARIVTAGFLMHLGVTPSQLADIKTVVSEAVTNAIVHGYEGGGKDRYILLEMCFFEDRTLQICVTDKGRGIEDVERAMEPFYTTDREGERSGMGLPIICAFCDKVKIVTRPGYTRIRMRKKLG